MASKFETTEDNWDVCVGDGHFLGYIQATEEMLTVLSHIQDKDFESLKAELTSITAERTKFLGFALKNLP